MHTLWSTQLQGDTEIMTPLYSSLMWLVCDTTQLTKSRPLIESTGNLRTVPCIAVHLKILRLGLSWFNWWVSFAPEYECCYFYESSFLFYLSFNFDFYVSKIIHL